MGNQTERGDDNPELPFTNLTHVRNIGTHVKNYAPQADCGFTLKAKHKDLNPLLNPSHRRI